MKIKHFYLVAKIIACSFVMIGCQSSDFASLQTSAASLLNGEKPFFFVQSKNADVIKDNQTEPLNEILKKALAERNEGTDFVSTLESAIKSDPTIISLKRDIEGKKASIASFEARKDYQVKSTIYGGIEDITDDVKGVALSLNASRLIFDGGLLEAQIASKSFEAEAARLNLRANIDERAYQLGEVWLELEKYEALQEKINARLAILDPLIDQLEQVAKAGIGDVSKVTAAQRTVSGIRVTQTNISEGLAKARLEYQNLFGLVDNSIFYDSDFVSNLLPDEIDAGLAQKSPILLSKYESYRAALANLEAVKAKAEFNVGFEARALRPFAGSGYDSDESIGLVASKTLFNGGMFESEIIEAESAVKSARKNLESAYRRGVQLVESAKQSIESMDKAIVLARENANVTSDEIIYLRQQLVIGASTLDSVLSAEARLYEAESKEVDFLASKRKSELLIASTLGLLSSTIDIK